GRPITTMAPAAKIETTTMPAASDGNREPIGRIRHRDPCGLVSWLYAIAGAPRPLPNGGLRYANYGEIRDTPAAQDLPHGFQRRPSPRSYRNQRRTSYARRIPPCAGAPYAGPTRCPTNWRASSTSAA